MSTENTSTETNRAQATHIEVVKGKQATVYYEAARCIHSRGCVLNNPDVFVPNVKGEWIHPDAEPVDVLMRIAKECVSGAIRVELNDGSVSSNTSPIVNTIRVRENGPLAIEAELAVRGEKQNNPRATLCRCGQSKNKPFCDGSHNAAEFKATGEPETQDFKALAKRNGVVGVEPKHNGPLRIIGNLELVSGTGRSFDKVEEVFLCRCGHSDNKPYCDGSHIAAKFEAE